MTEQQTLEATLEQVAAALEAAAEVVASIDDAPTSLPQSASGWRAPSAVSPIGSPQWTRVRP
jgi:hypothetical protein